MGEGLIGFFEKYGQQGLEYLRELKAKGQGYASQVDNYFGIEPKPDPRTLPPRPKDNSGNALGLGDGPIGKALGFRKPDQPIPNTYFGQPVERSGFKPYLDQYLTAVKKANPLGILNTAPAPNPLPPEQTRAAIRAKFPGAEGEVATGGFAGQGMQSGRGPGQIPRGGIPLDASQYRTQPQPQQPMPLSTMPRDTGQKGGGIDNAIMAHRQQQQQVQQEEKIKQQQMDKNGRFGMSGYFDKLFNDPSRMAMLQGGLTMMDPSSYYDREGFGSPWTGLRAGMGAAGKGYQGVKKRQMDERKSEAEIGLAGAKALESINTAEEAGTLNIAKYGSIAKTPEGTFYIDGYNRAQAIARGVSLKEATKQNSFQIGSSRFKEKMKQSQAQSDASIRMIEEVLGTAGDPNDPGMIDWNTVGIPGVISGVGESIASFFTSGMPMEATQLELASDWIKAMTWRDLVGSGQISKYDYNRLETMLGVRGFLDSPDKVRIKYQEAMDYIKSKRQKPGTYLMGNKNISEIAAPDLSVLGNMGNTFSPIGGLSESEAQEAAPYF